MYKAITFMFLLFLPISAWAWKPVSDYDLSNATSPPSLNIQQEPVDEQGLEGGEAEDLSEVFRMKKRFSFSSVLSNKDEGAVDIDDFKIDKKLMSDAGSDDALDRNSINDAFNGKVYSMMYHNRLKVSSDKPVITDLRPDGRNQLRIYFTNNAGYTIQPNSWVDIKPR